MTFPPMVESFLPLSAMIGALPRRTGRGATFVVAASDAPGLVKLQADYVCNGTADDATIQVAIDALPATGGKIELSIGTFTLAANVTLGTGIMVQGQGAATVITGAFAILVQGTLSATASDLAVAAVRGQKTVTVVDASNFSVDDAIEIVGSPNESSSTTTKRQRELNIVTAVNEATDVITLKFPLSHPYPIGFATEPDVTVVSALVENVAIESLSLSGTDVTFGYIIGFVLNGLRCASESVISCFNSASRNVTIEDVTIEDVGASVTGALVLLHGITGLTSDGLRIYGGAEDGIRLYGCAQASVRCEVYEAPSRSIWMFRCTQVDVHDSACIGSQISTSNIEDTIVDTSFLSGFTRLYVNQPNKTSLASAAEIRGASEDCYYRESTFHGYSTTVFVHKWVAIRAYIDRNTFIVHTGSTNCIGAEGDTSVGSSVSVRYNQVESPDDVSSIFFADSSNEDHTNVVELVEIIGNHGERQAGTWVAYNGSATGATTRLVRVENNATRDENGSSGEFGSVQRPVDTLIVTGNIMETPGDRRFLVDNTDSVIINNNEFGDIQVSGATVAQIRNNVGYVTENSGTGTINSGDTTVVITHGLSVTPTLDDISVTFGEQGTNDYGRWWISSMGSTQFTINVSADPGASNLDLAWRAAVL